MNASSSELCKTSKRAEQLQAFRHLSANVVRGRPNEVSHKDLPTTQIYAKVRQEPLRKVVGKLTGLVPIPEFAAASHNASHTTGRTRATARTSWKRWDLGDEATGMAERVWALDDSR